METGVKLLRGDSTAMTDEQIYKEAYRIYCYRLSQRGEIPLELDKWLIQEANSYVRINKDGKKRILIKSFDEINYDLPEVQENLGKVYQKVLSIKDK